MKATASLDNDKSHLVKAMALSVLAVLAAARADAQVVRPFKVVGAGTVDYVPLVPFVPVRHDATGVATGLGAYRGVGKVQLTGLTSPTTGTFDSAVPFVFKGANGDRAAFTYGDTSNGAAGPGQVMLFPTYGGRVIAVWVAEFNPVPRLSTGPFAKVIAGSFLMVAVTEPFVPGRFDPVKYSWEGQGVLTFPSPH